MVDLGFEQGLSKPKQLVGPQSGPGYHIQCWARGEREEGSCSGALSVGGSLRGARLPGLQNLAGISQALWSKQGYHHGNHCQGISSLVCTGGLRGCGRGWLLSGCGRREREEAGRLFAYSSQTPPTARGPAQNIPERSLEKKAREMGEARCTE